MSVRALVGLGSNLGDRAGNLAAAVDALAKEHGLAVVAVAKTVETDALLPPGDPTLQPRYLNTVVELDCALPAEELLFSLKRIEARLGRSDATRWAARPIDLDVLFFGDEVRTALPPLVPHPELHLRRFVLEPLAELAPQLVHPGLQKTVAELLAGLP